MKKLIPLCLAMLLLIPSFADAGFRARQRQKQQNAFNAGVVAGLNAANNGHHGGSFNGLRAPRCR